MNAVSYGVWFQWGSTWFPPAAVATEAYCHPNCVPSLMRVSTSTCPHTPGFKFQGAGFRFQVSGFRARARSMSPPGGGSKVWGLGCEVWGLGLGLHLRRMPSARGASILRGFRGACARIWSEVCELGVGVWVCGLGFRVHCGRFFVGLLGCRV